MASDLDARPPLVRFLDSFLQERNIKWMLGIGVLLLFGSSLRLVLSHWEHYSPLWKSLILVGYTASVYFAGEVCRKRLALQRTATVLLSLTVLLMPLTFHAFHHVRGGTAAVEMPLIVVLPLAMLAGALAFVAAGRIFRLFLRGTQPTFLVSYLILCVAGALLPETPLGARPWLMLGLWGVFAAGVVKVNRHVFWLAEAHRLPRVFGFFPILLLGTQFLALFALHAARQVPLDWMGVGCVLAAVPVLLTADAVARVFEQRTGGLVRPWPWSIVLPFVSGLVLCAAGVCLSAVDMPRPMALAPAATLTAVLMGVTAQRTKSSAFVWAMLAAVLVAYRYSPLYFQELTQLVLQTGARAVREERLPLAFYGLTCLPLIAVLMAFARRLAVRGDALFAVPLRQFVVGLSAVLLAASFGHPKAIFPVGLAMTGVFAAQTVLFRQRVPLMLGIAAAVTVAVGLLPFMELVVGLALPVSTPFFAVASVAAALFVAGPAIDCWSAGFEEAGRADRDVGHTAWPICRWFGLVLTFSLALGWTAWVIVHPAAAIWGAGALIGALCFGQAYRNTRVGIGEAALAFPMLLGTIDALHRGVAMPDLIGGLAAVAVVQWGAAVWMARYPSRRVALAFGRPARHVGLFVLTALLVLVALPGLVLLSIPGLPLGAWVAEWFPIVAAAIAVAWSFDAARRTGWAGYAIAGCASVLAAASAGVHRFVGHAEVWQWYPAAWGMTALLALPVAIHLRRRVERLALIAADDAEIRSRLDGLRAVEFPVWQFTLGVLLCVAVGSLLMFMVPFRIAGGVALLGLVGLVASRQVPDLRPAIAPLANWQLLAGAVWLLAPDLRSLADLRVLEHLHLLLAISGLAGVSLVVFEIAALRRRPETAFGPHDDLMSWGDAHCLLLRMIIGMGVAMSLAVLKAPVPPALDWLLVTFAAIAFVGFATAELIAACRNHSEGRVWLAELVIALAVIYFVLFGIVTFGHGLSMYAALAAGLLVWMAGAAAGRDERFAVLAGPFVTTGLLLPLATVAIGVFRHIAVDEPAWLGANSLALLMAAAFYFWRGLERREVTKLVAAAGILNLALALLWRELHWSDPQFFLIPLGVSVLGLVELLKRQIDATYHDPLRYAGALLILVSPTFHIVGGSWWHLISLMVLSVAVALLAIGLRIRVLLYAGTAFLAADLVAMLVRGSVDHPNLLWIAGIGIGTAVIALAAVCENHREKLLSRLRGLAAELETWT